MTRLRLLASVATFGIVAMWAGTAFAGTISTPAAPFTVPLNAAGTAPAPFKIVASGFTFGSQVFVMVCDGTAPSAVDWDPNINCDNGTSPQAASVQSNGTAMWDPAVTKNQAIDIFDGTSPSGSFNCYNPGETTLSDGEADPTNGLASWTDCQIRVATTNGAVTSDQAFLTFTLPALSGSAGTTTTTVGATTTTIPATTTTTTVPASSTTTTSTTTSTTTTTIGGTTTTSTSDPSDGGTTSTTGSTTTSAVGSASSGTTTTTTAVGLLAVTGVSPGGLVLIALCLVTIGIIAKSRGTA